MYKKSVYVGLFSPGTNFINGHMTHNYRSEC